MFDTDARDLTFLNLEGVKINNRQLFWIAAGIIAILLLLIGAYALIGTNNNTTATPTPTPTATPLPQGQGTGIGQGSEAPTVTPTPTAAPTAAPTPAPQPTMGVLTYNSTWPLYDFHWVAGTGTNTIRRSR
jgi:hypothetical protein